MISNFRLDLVAMVAVGVAMISPASAQQSNIHYSNTGNSPSQSQYDAPWGTFRDDNQRNWTYQDEEPQESPSDVVNNANQDGQSDDPMDSGAADTKSDETKLKEQLAKYESQLQAQDELIEKQAGSIDKINGKLKDFVKMGHGGETLKLFGRLHFDYWSFPFHDAGIEALEGGNPQDRFQFHRMRFGVSGDIDDNMFYKIEMEFAGGEDPSYRDAILGWNDLPCLNKVIVGNHKRPYGLDHLNSSRYNTFIERPFIVEAFNQDSRRLGVSSNGVSEDQQYNWRYGVWNHLLTQTGPGYVGDHYQSEFAGRLARTWWWDESSGGRSYAHIAVSSSIGALDGLPGGTNAARYRTRPEARSTNRWWDTGVIAGADDFQLLGLESVTTLGPLQLTSEYMMMNVDRSAGFGPALQFNGGYTQVSYFLTGEHIPWNRTTGTLGRVQPFENFFKVRDCDGCVQRGLGAWEIAARYSYADLTDQDIIGGDGEAFTFAVNWWWNKHARWQFNYINGQVDRGAAGGGDYSIIGTRFMVDF